MMLQTKMAEGYVVFDTKFCRGQVGPTPELSGCGMTVFYLINKTSFALLRVDVIVRPDGTVAENEYGHDGIQIHGLGTIKQALQAMGYKPEYNGKSLVFNRADGAEVKIRKDGYAFVREEICA